MLIFCCTYNGNENFAYGVKISHNTYNKLVETRQPLGS